MTTFEDNYQLLKDLVEKRRNKWKNLLPHGMAFEDLSSIILAHIARKWNLYDQNKSLPHWANTVISNQIFNLTRNNYLSYAKPCLNCEFNLSCGSMEENHIRGSCAFTSSGSQDSECSKYAVWEKTKLPSFQIKVPVSLEKYAAEVIHEEADNFDYDAGLDLIKKKMKDLLIPKHYDIFIMLYFEKLTDEEVAVKAGYWTKEANRKPGYAQIASLKKKFRTAVKQIVDEMNSDE